MTDQTSSEARDPRIKVRRIDTRNRNRWEFSIDGRVSGRAPSDSAALSRAKAMIASAGATPASRP